MQKHKVHHLKIKPNYFNAVFNGYKDWEIRKNNRNYKTGDYLYLHEYDKDYTGRAIVTRIMYLFNDFGLKKGYVIMSIKKQEFLDLSHIHDSIL